MSNAASLDYAANFLISIDKPHLRRSRALAFVLQLVLPTCPGSFTPSGNVVP